MSRDGKLILKLYTGRKSLLVPRKQRIHFNGSLAHGTACRCWKCVLNSAAHTEVHFAPLVKIHFNTLNSHLRKITVETHLPSLSTYKYC